MEFILPTDVIIADKFAPDADTKTVSIESIPDGWMGLDIGPDSLKTFQGALADAKTVIWNGPMGVFEFDAFAKGTYGVADTLAELTPKARRAPLSPLSPHLVVVRLGLLWRLGRLGHDARALSPRRGLRPQPLVVGEAPGRLDRCSDLHWHARLPLARGRRLALAPAGTTARGGPDAWDRNIAARVAASLCGLRCDGAPCGSRRLRR